MVWPRERLPKSRLLIMAYSRGWNHCWMKMTCIWMRQTATSTKPNLVSMSTATVGAIAWPRAIAAMSSAATRVTRRGLYRVSQMLAGSAITPKPKNPAAPSIPASSGDTPMSSCQ